MKSVVLFGSGRPAPFNTGAAGGCQKSEFLLGKIRPVICRMCDLKP